MPVNTAASVSKIVAESRQSPKLLDRVRALIRAKQYSLRTERLLAQSDGTAGLFLRLLYGTGRGIMECATLRLKDIDFGARSITVRAGKGATDRFTVLPDGVIDDLRLQLQRVRAAHDNELAVGRGDVELPFAVERKYPRGHLPPGRYDHRRSSLWFVGPLRRKASGTVRFRRKSTLDPHHRAHHNQL